MKNNVIIKIHDNSTNQRLENSKNWNVPEKVKKDINKFTADAEIGKVNLGRKLDEATISKNLSNLKVILEFFNKNLEDLEVKDIENFERKLTKGEIEKKHGKGTYSTETQRHMKIDLKKILKWKLGEAKMIQLAGWLDMRQVKKTPEYLKEIEIERLYKSCKTIWQRFVIAVLFDSGARAEEFHNIRYEDINLPEGNNNYVKITLKEEYSKTKGRVVSLFWKHSLEAVKDYINQRIDEGIKPKDPIFNIPYDTTRKFLSRTGKEILGKPLHYHLFRHSSATYYADKMNGQQLCIRYGWGFSSDMVDVYISRAGVDEKELETKFTGTEINKLKDELEKERKANGIMKEEFDKIREQNKIFEEFMGKWEEKLRKVPILSTIK